MSLHGWREQRLTPVETLIWRGAYVKRRSCMRGRLVSFAATAARPTWENTVRRKAAGAFHGVSPRGVLVGQFRAFVVQRTASLCTLKK